MKRLAVISLIIVFLTGQYAFASCPCEKFIQLKNPQNMTVEEFNDINPEANAGEILTFLIVCLGILQICNEIKESDPAGNPMQNPIFVFFLTLWCTLCAPYFAGDF